jgi:hypothetical protein
MLATLNGAPSWENARIEVEREDSRDFLELMIGSSSDLVIKLKQAICQISLQQFTLE